MDGIFGSLPPPEPTTQDLEDHIAMVEFEMATLDPRDPRYPGYQRYLHELREWLRLTQSWATPPLFPAYPTSSSRMPSAGGPAQGNGWPDTTPSSGANMYGQHQVSQARWSAASSSNPTTQAGNAGAFPAQPSPIPIIDLTQDDAPLFSPMVDSFRDPFPELTQAFSANGPSSNPGWRFPGDEDGLLPPLSQATGTPANAFNPNASYMGLDELSQFLGQPNVPLFPPGNQAMVPPTSFVDLTGPDYDAHSPVEENPEQIQDIINNIQPDVNVPRELRDRTPPQMSCSLMEHQKLALMWLKKAEESPHKGGILADEMGLGKTIEAISLIVARPSRDHIRKTTLVVAPVALMRQWEKEIERHVRPEHRLEVHVYHDRGKNADFARLRRFDVVLTTYGALASELTQLESERENSNNHRRPGRKLALLGPESHWYRVILDEAQWIKNKQTKMSRAADKLKADYRLCMTGTPMMNSLDELYPLIRFLGIKPYNVWTKFNMEISKPVKDRNKETQAKALRRAQALLKSMMLRRQKTTIIDGKEICSIPPKEIHHHAVPFSKDELELYRAIETQSQVDFNRYLQSGATGITVYAQILLRLLRLRQACCHPHLIKDLGAQVATARMSEEELLNRARQLSADATHRLMNEDSFQCPICLDSVLNPTILIPCGHTCCGECFQKLTDPAYGPSNSDGEGGVRCPSCRGPSSANMITDYKHFCRVFCPEKLLTYPELYDSDVDDSDDDDDADDVVEEDDEGSDLGGFIVPDDECNEDNDDEIQMHAEPSTGRRKTGKGKKRAKPKLTLAQLKHASQKNAAAKRAYLQRLRKQYQSSSKIDKTLELVSQIHNHDPTEKILIFSQFSSLLDLVEVPLEAAGYRYQRYDGSMTMDNRAQAVNEFMDDPNQNIMLISLKAGNAGLNLNKASQVIILDPFWNPYIEDQAVDRAHRMPQKRVVHVHRLLVPDTVEDRIIELQEKKREMIDAALDESEGRKITGLGRRELMYLFGMGNRPF
ncbi:uncharacterized protein EI97DRAFT_436036 [Westerdykella ornata]|uniref:SWI/SNF family DNA-dependent ATPase Ris1 n=1 Tax=Westerdykella ornata TaxID=318751 RepID=A0A6A6JAP2_WESOR|nr:uncharacterized protein EI97DRAFT_436036 [Westerdykella ornata]KAF2273385.1 hypothetical protein EI97DRAFT_436036 [Westerdykella ornata]